MDREGDADCAYEGSFGDLGGREWKGCNMKSVIVRNLKIGEGIPKICVPLVGVSIEQIEQQARALAGIPADLAEWRADWFEGVFDDGQVAAVLQMLRAQLNDMPLLFTFRTALEGGEREIGADAYTKLLKTVIQTGCADLVDVQVFMGDAAVKEIVAAARGAGVKTVASNHDFEKTPSKEEMIRRLLKMQELGADIAKIAVMPQEKRDVLELLAATEEMHRKYAKGPVITMSMAGMGAVSRLCGEVFGSAVTFGAAERASAPGQAGVRELAEALALVHTIAGSPDGTAQRCCSPDSSR